MLIFNNMARSKQLQHLEPWHHDLIDSMLANPEWSGREAAAHFGVSPVWISIIKNSEVFRVEFERRREELSQTVTADIAGRVTKLAMLSLDVLKERIERDRGSVSLREVRETAKLVLKMLGYGAPRHSEGRAVNINIGVDAQSLAEARQQMRFINEGTSAD